MTVEVWALRKPQSPLPAGEGWVRESPPNPNENQTTPPSFPRKRESTPRPIAASPTVIPAPAGIWNDGGGCGDGPGGSE